MYWSFEKIIFHRYSKFNYLGWNVKRYISYSGMFLFLVICPARISFGRSIDLRSPGGPARILFLRNFWFSCCVYSQILWSCMKKVFFFPPFYRNISTTAETILIKRIGWNHGISVYKKALISEHWKNYIFRDNKCFVKISVSLLVN